MLVKILRGPVFCAMTSVALLLFAVSAGAIPTLNVSTLADGSITSSQTLNVSGVAKDGTNGVNSVAVNGLSVPLTADGSFSHALKLSAGANNVTTVATDADGKSIQDTRVVTFDQSTPKITIISPADNIATSQSPVTVTGTVDMNVPVEILVNGSSQATMSGPGFTADVILAQGLNTITITARDQVANKSSTAKRTIVYDTTTPTLQIQDPPQDFVTSRSSYTIRGTISDTQSDVTVAFDGVTSTPPVNNGVFEKQVNFSENKSYRITATASDAAGKETAVTRNIIYDNVPPAKTVAAAATAAATAAEIPDNVPPAITGVSSTTAAGYYNAGDSINVTLTFSEPVFSSGLAILLSTGATITSGTLSGVISCSGTYTVGNGQNTSSLDVTSVSGTLSDSAGNQNANPSIPVGRNIKNTVTITVDTIAPLVNAGQNQIRNALFTQIATVSDYNSNGLTYLWKQQSGSGIIKLGSPTALVTTISADVDGPYVLRLTSTDAAGNTAYNDMTLVWDTKAPSVNAGGDKAANTTFTQTGIVVDATALTYLWEQKSGPGTIYFGSKTNDVTTIEATVDGTYLLHLSATDAAGNSSFGQMTLTWDTKPPSSVSAGGDKTANTLFTQTGTASSDATAFLWEKISGPGDITFGPPTALVTTIKATVDGTYVLRLKASDAAGNFAYSDMKLTWDTTAPTVDAGGNKTTKAEFTQTATASTDSTALTYLWSGPGAITFGSKTALVTTIKASADGTYVLRLTATDAAGNSSFSEMTLIWDTTAPTVNAGGNKTAEAVFTQTATASSDTTAVTYLWEKKSGPGNITFGSSTALVTTISASANGTYVLRLTATDAAGNSSFSEMTLIWKTAPPPLDVTSPAGDTRSTQESIVISGNTQPGVIVTITIDPDTTPLKDQVTFTPTVDKGNGSFSQAITLSGENIYTIAVKATDYAGSESIVKRRVILGVPNGNVNGLEGVDLADAVLALQVSVGMRKQLDSYLVKGDVGPFKDGKPAPDWKIDISDVVLILRVIVGQISL